MRYMYQLIQVARLDQNVNKPERTIGHKKIIRSHDNGKVVPQSDNPSTKGHSKDFNKLC